MSRTAGVRRVRDYFRSHKLRNRVLMPVGLLIVALAAGCVSSAPAVSDERAEVLTDVVERWILEVEDLRSVLEGVTDGNSSIRSIRDVRSRVNAMRSILLEAGERSDDDEAYVQAEFGDRLGEAIILLDAERRRLGVDGTIGTDIPDMLAFYPRFGDS